MAWRKGVPRGRPFSLGDIALGPTALAALIYVHLAPRIGTGLGIVLLNEIAGRATLLAIPMILRGIFLATRRRP